MGGTTGPALVIGYGNELRSDDGAGFVAAQRMADDPRMAGVRVIARRQLTPDLALDISRAGTVVFVDASRLLAPGEVSSHRLEPAAGRASSTSHHMTPEELLGFAAELYGAAPTTLTVSVGVDSMEMGDGLSPAVEEALPSVIDEVARVTSGRADA